ncbi:hypothetical protein MHBO_001933 [Bonamia ostreae]|uniref:Uncharacterized protein n=1 Tax=Bonamia ostreae TaxID=126728 RepID=A0ABV2ALQ5_9EUKA
MNIALFLWVKFIDEITPIDFLCSKNEAADILRGVEKENKELQKVKAKQKVIVQSNKKVNSFDIMFPNGSENDKNES